MGVLMIVLHVIVVVLGMRVGVGKNPVGVLMGMDVAGLRCFGHGVSSGGWDGTVLGTAQPWDGHSSGVDTDSGNPGTARSRP
jgi:hypothetical protein